MDPLTIEKVVEENFDDFVALIQGLAEYERLKPPDESAVTRLKQDGLSVNPKYEAYLGRVSGEAVSYVVFFPTYSSFQATPSLFLEDIFVREAYRRKGIGQKMLAFCVERALEWGYGRMEWCVLDWNEPAIRFYEKNHAERLNWTFYRLKRENMHRFSLQRPFDKES